MLENVFIWMLVNKTGRSSAHNFRFAETAQPHNATRHLRYIVKDGIPIVNGERTVSIHIVLKGAMPDLYIFS